MQRKSCPRGRSELLRWLNDLFNFDYPAVECLRDGASYCMIIEATIKRIAANCLECNVAGGNCITVWARHASALLSKVDLTVTVAVCESVDPSLDSMLVRRICHNNMSILQEMLRECVPAKYKLEIDVDRLVLGKLQDHVKLLQWIHQFLSRMLTEYSKAALEKKSLQKYVKVQGVKLNRATILLEQKRLRKDTIACLGDLRKDSGSLENHGTLTSQSGLEQRQFFRDEFVAFPIDKQEQLLFSEKEVPSASETDVAGIVSNTHNSLQGDNALKRTGMISNQSQKACKLSNRSGEFRKRKNSEASFYPTTSVVVPTDLKQMLDNVRREVESLEQVIIQTHDNHYAALRCRDSSSQLLQVIDGKEQSTGTNIPSLHDLGTLLEERDLLSRDLAAIDHVMHKFCRKGISTPFLRNILSILYRSTIQSRT